MRYRSYLSRSRTGSFHFRLHLPAHVAASIGVREIRRSLATRDVIEARRRRWRAFPLSRLTTRVVVVIIVNSEG